jgi:hypothetical protein
MSAGISGTLNGIVNMATQYDITKTTWQQAGDFGMGFLTGMLGGLISPFGLAGSAAGSFITQTTTCIANGANPYSAIKRGLLSAGIVGICGTLASAFASEQVKEAIAWSLLATDVDQGVDAFNGLL